MTHVQRPAPRLRHADALIRVLTEAAPGALILPALAISGPPVRAPAVEALIAVLIAGTVFVAAAWAAAHRALGVLAVAMVGVAAWLLAQVSYPTAGWIAGAPLGAGIGFSYVAGSRSRRRAILPPALAGASLALLQTAAGRSPAMGAGAALAVGAGLAAYVAPHPPQSALRAGALGLAGVLLLVLSTAYVGATTPRAAWFGTLSSHGPRDSNLVALTFDDGPDDPYTVKVRDILDAHGVKGTFFIVGKALDARPDIARALLTDGHLLGNHSYRHDAVRWLDPRYPELQAAEDAFRRNLGVCPAFFRPPHGTHTPFMARVVGDHGMRMITWDVSAADWGTNDAQLVARRVLANVRPGSIILLHDGIDGSVSADRSVLLAALPLILDGLAARGLQPVTLDRLLGTPGYLETC